MNYICILFYFGKKILRVETVNEKKKRFVFENDGTIDGLLLQFVNHELLCEPMKLWDSMSAVKSMVYAM